MFFSTFRDSQLMQDFCNDLQNFTNYLNTNYPEDETIKQWTYTLQNVYNVPLTAAAANATTKQKTRRTTNKKEEIRKRLQASYNTDRYIEGDINLQFTDEATCIENLRTLQNLQTSNNKRAILLSSHQGQYIQYLKSIIPKSQNIQDYLQQKNIHFTAQKCRALVILYDLVSQFSTLLHCDIPVSFLIKNSKTIKEVCKELKW